MAFDYAAKIAALIAHAEDEANSPEARATYRAKAESMMRDYRIAEEDLIATDQFAAVPVLDKVIVMESNAYDNPLRDEYWSLFSRIARHAGIRLQGRYTGWSGDNSQLAATVVGYEGDIAYAKFIWTAARLVFLTRIDASVNRSLSDQQNCYYMRNSGLTRKEIATALWRSSATDGAAHGKVQKLYFAECAARGETPRVSGRGIQVDIYRKAYARAFVNEFGWRLNEAKDAAGTSGGGLVLHGRAERVDEAFYKEFPNMRPSSKEENEEAMRRMDEEEANCPDCKKTTSKSGKCKRHRPTEISEAERRRYARMTRSPEARAGSANGTEAARAVNLARGFERTAATDAPASRDAIGG
jgi:hypothetical protein